MTAHCPKCNQQVRCYKSVEIYVFAEHNKPVSIKKCENSGKPVPSFR